MKQTRVSAASFALVKTSIGALGSIVCITASLTVAASAQSAEEPFTEHVISNAANGTRSVFALDVDGDGDIDVLSASLFDDKIAWYENDGGSPPTFTERVISTLPTTPGPFLRWMWTET